MKFHNLTRLLIISLIILVFSFRVDFIKAQEEDLSVLERWIEWSDSENMLIHHLNDQAFKLLDRRDSIIISLKTKDDWVKRQKEVKSRLSEILGPFPEKTPLNARITGIVRKEGYKIEKTVFESMPGFHVTGCLFIPEGIKGRRPAILNVIGHTDISFRGDAYQNLILHLVGKGFIVFAIDPIGQGERLQYFDPSKSASMVGAGTSEHSYFGNQCFLNGISPALYFVWDGIRAIDYLISRKEVDPARIGVTGLSGGGTQTAFISALDERVKASAPSCYITGFRRLLESIGAQDAEQNFYHGLKEGITHADLIEIRAPKPTLIVSTTRDFFSIQGARESYYEAKKAFKAFGQPDDLLMSEDDYEHGFTLKNNEATCAFFQKYLDLPGNKTSGEIKTIPPEELKITSTGQISTSFNCETVFSVNAKYANGLITNIENSRKEIENHLAMVKRKAMELSGFNYSCKDPISIFRGAYQREGYKIEMYALQGNGNYVIPLLIFIPSVTGKYPAIIYLNPNGKIGDAAPGGRIENIVKKGFIVVAPDILGIGELAPDKSFFNASYFISALTGKSLAGIGAEDICSVLEFLKERKDVDTTLIGSVAFDKLCPVMVHAATFNQSIRSLVLIGSLTSYRSVVQNMFYNSDLAAYNVAGALKGYDIPDLLGCIAPRKIILSVLKDQMSQPAGEELIMRDLEFPLKVYTKSGKRDNLQIRYSYDDIGEMIERSF